MPPTGFPKFQTQQYFNGYASRNTDFLLPLTTGAQCLKGLNLVRCGTRNMFGLSDDILPQGERPTFIAIAVNEAYIIGSKIDPIHHR